ncbi:hypothetical protein AVEN_111762-1 [Araneus ventricosus]|uniref:Uncharacterized protein n=1 Tax=Araneus ventricosus TaxID=182803 RepID=A0A4Y2FUB7_ARAVE|nr:hypothetical protein AVEN_111762-1 [Araneus ventricosus]
MEKVPTVLENDSSTITSEDFPKTAASQDILEEISPLPSSFNKESKRKKISSDFIWASFLFCFLTLKTLTAFAGLLDFRFEDSID